MSAADGGSANPSASSGPSPSSGPPPSSGPSASAGPSASSGPVPALSVVIPAFGEAKRIASTLASLRTGLGAWAPVELIVVDDGSTDDTAAAARHGGADQVIRLTHNRGKGAAVRTGVLAARGPVVAFTDADLAYAPGQVDKVAHEVAAGADVVVGHRVSGTGRTDSRLRSASHRLFQLLTRLVVSNTHADTQCGLKAFSADAAGDIFGAARIDGFAFDVELFLVAERRGWSVVEIAVEASGSDGSTVRLRSQVSRMVRDLLRLRRWLRAGVYDRSEVRR